MKKKSITAIISFVIIAVIWFVWLSMIVNNTQLTGRTGSSVATVGLVVTPPFDQQINLTKGWNFISFYVIFGDYSITTVLAPIDGYYDYIQEWDGSTQDFKIWSKNGQKDFTKFNQNKSYFVYVNQDVTLNIGGTMFENWTIGLLPGWETPDYIYEYSSNVTNDTIYNVTFSYMQKWNASEQEFLAYSPIAAINPFDKIYPSEGYLIRTEGGSVVYIRV